MQQPHLSVKSARRLATATTRVNRARQVGPKATVDALRAVLLAASRAHPSSPVIDEVADHVLGKLHELYADADRMWGGS
jgi:hypothetical protein